MSEGFELPIELDMLSEVCTWCTHLDNVALRSCAAFDEIPAEIWQGVNNHTKPYEGDGGIQFARIEEGGASAKSIKAVDPREAAERKLREALEALFANLASDIAGKIAKGEPVPDELLIAAFGSVIEPQLVEAATAEGIRIAAEVGVQFDPAIVNEAMVQWARTYNYDLVRGLTDTTRKVVQNAMSKYAATPGMTRGELEALLEPAFGTARAESIAVTEVTKAYSEAMNKYQADLAGDGISMTRIFHTSHDEIVCPKCAPWNMKPESEWGQQYPSGPPLHSRCRCSVTLKAVKG